MLTGVRSLRERSIRRALLPLLAAGTLWPAGATAHDDPRNQIATLTREIAAEPANAVLYLRRAELYRLERVTPAALADYDRAQRLDPGLAAADLGAARALREAKRPADAKRRLERFLRARPDDGEGRLELARVLADLHSTAAADAAYARAIALASSPRPDAYFERARLLESAGRLSAAIRSLDEGIARLGPIASLEELALELELARKNFDGALRRLDRIFPRGARPETRLTRRGEILASAGRPVEARETFRQAQRAIETLPPRLRRTRAIQKLEERVRVSLESLRAAATKKEKTDAKS